MTAFIPGAIVGVDSAEPWTSDVVAAKMMLETLCKLRMPDFVSLRIALHHFAPDSPPKSLRHAVVFRFCLPKRQRLQRAPQAVPQRNEARSIQQNDVSKMTGNLSL
jgi:hypothetical protein